MNALRLTGLVALLCVLAMAYLFQRDLSLRLTTRQARQAALTRVLSERCDRLAVEVAHLTGFGRLDSICGRARRSAPARAVARVEPADTTVTVAAAGDGR